MAGILEVIAGSTSQECLRQLIKYTRRGICDWTHKVDDTDLHWQRSRNFGWTIGGAGLRTGMNTFDHISDGCFLIEHSHGVCELWLKKDDSGRFNVNDPRRLTRLSGRGTVLLRAEMVVEAIELDKWMDDHFEVFTDGLTSPD